METKIKIEDLDKRDFELEYRNLVTMITQYFIYLDKIEKEDQKDSYYNNKEMFEKLALEKKKQIEKDLYKTSNSIL